jgi:hypothetical protein
METQRYVLGELGGFVRAEGEHGLGAHVQAHFE